MARGLVRSPDAMPDRVHVKFSYSAKDADVQEWIWKQPLGAVAEMANEYIAAVARGHVVHGHWKHDLVGDVPQKVEPRTADVPAAPVAQAPVARAAEVADDVSSPHQSVLGVEATAARAEIQPEPTAPVVAEESDAVVGEVLGPVMPPMAAGPVQAEVSGAAPEPQAEQRQDSNGSGRAASATPAAAPADRVADTSHPAAAETAGEGAMMRSDVRKIIEQAKNWQKK